MLLEPKPDNPCFGCGGANARGMKLTFEQDDAGQRIHGRFRLGEEYCGGPGFIHGGIIAVLLDEAMGKVSRFRQTRAVTAELIIEYLKFVGVGEDLVVEAREVEKNGRNLHRTAEIRNLAGELLARGRGRFVEIDPARIGQHSTTRGASGERITKS
ncbi:MAG TPA: PaaI family thioesterase [Candidatus Limnocylindria bacterium]|nr:PaaI family thioesterase [Candidatus Limnocylindria bacterium]